MNLPDWKADPLNPDDPPVYYSPSSLGSDANLRSNFAPQPPTSSRPQFDEMLEEAMANSRRHPLEVDFEPDERRRLFSVVSGVAAVIGVSATVGLVFLFSRASAPPTLAASEGRTMNASAGAAKVMSEESQAVLQKLVELRKLQESNEPKDDVTRSTGGGSPKVLPENSQALLEKFRRWDRKQ